MRLPRSAFPVVARNLTRGALALLLLTQASAALAQRPVVPTPERPPLVPELRVRPVATAVTAVFTPASLSIGAGQQLTVTATCNSGDPWVGADAGTTGLAFGTFAYPAAHTIQATVFGLEPSQGKLVAKCKITPTDGGSPYLTDVLARANVTILAATATLAPNPVSVKVGGSASVAATCSGGQPWIGGEGTFGGFSFGTFTYDFNARKTQTTVNGAFPGQGSLIVKCRIQGPVGSTALSDVAARAPLTVTP